MIADENAVIFFYYKGDYMTMWKKLTTVALASMLALSLAACSADDEWKRYLEIS